MDENLHNIDDLFKKALEEHDENASPKVWENIDNNLDKKKVVSIYKKYQKLKWVAAALFIFSMGMAMYTIETRIKNRELVDQNKNKQSHTINKKTTKIDKKDIVTGNRSTAFAERKTGGGTVTRKTGNNPYAQVSGSDIIAFTKPEINRHKPDFEKLLIKKNPQKDFKNVSANFNGYKADEKQNETKTGKPLRADDLAAGETNAFGIKKTEEDKSIAAKEKAGRAKDLADATEQKLVRDVAIVSRDRQNLSHAALPDLSLKGILDESERGRNIIQPGRLNAKTSNRYSKSAKKSLFSATVFYSPDFVGSRVDNDHNRFREDDRDEIKNKEEIKNSSRLGVLINYNAGKNFSIQSGLAYSTTTTTILPKMIFARPDMFGNVNYRFNCSAGYSDITLHPGNPPALGDSISTLSSLNTLKYISVPLTVRYKISRGKFSVNPGLGIAANLLAKGSIETVIPGAAGNEKENINHIEGLNKSYLNGALSLGLNYNFNRFFGLSFTPVTRFALTAINKNAPVKTYLNSFGLEAGITLRL